jgi:type IV secretion system protein VirB4
MIERVLAEHGREGFVTGWLAARGMGWAADLVPGLRVQEGLS